MVFVELLETQIIVIYDLTIYYLLFEL